MWVQAVRYHLFSSGVFLSYFSMLILSLPLLGLGSKSTSLSPGFCVRRPRQYDTICWELDLISGFFVFFLLIVWADGINKCGWCLAGDRGCWLKGPHQIPSVSWICHHFYTSTFTRLPHLYQEFYVHCIVITNGWGDGWFITGCGAGGGYYLVVFVFVFFFTCVFVLCFLMSSVPLHDSCCVCFFVFLFLFCLWSL